MEVEERADYKGVFVTSNIRSLCHVSLHCKTRACFHTKDSFGMPNDGSIMSWLNHGSFDIPGAAHRLHSYPA